MLKPWHVLLMALSSLMHNLFLVSFVLSIIFRIKDRITPEKKKEITPEKHIYYPYRYSAVTRIFSVIAVALGFFVELPLFTYLQLYLNGRDDMQPLFGAYLIVGVFLIITIVKKPKGKVVDRVITDTEGLMICYKSEAPVRHSYRDYITILKTGSFMSLFFGNGAETEKRVPLNCLCNKDAEAVAEDLKQLKLNGQLTGSGTVQRKPAPDAAKEQIQQSTGLLSEEAWQAELRRIQEEQEKLRANPMRYGEYMRSYAAKLTSEQKQEIVRLAENNDKIHAIKLCRELTGLGLKDAKEMVDDYRKYLVTGGSRPSGAYADKTIAENMAETHAGSSILDKPVFSSTSTSISIMGNPVYVNASPVVEPTIPSVVHTGSNSAFGGTVQPTGFDQTATGAPGWTIRITDNERAVTDQRSLESDIDHALSEINMGREEFLVLSSPEPVRGIEFLQVCKDTNGIFYHIEAGLTERNAPGGVKLLGRDHVMNMEVKDIFLKYYRGEEVQLSWWDEL